MPPGPGTGGPVDTFAKVQLPFAVMGVILSGLRQVIDSSDHAGG
jgi:hypothetical protein